MTYRHRLGDLDSIGRRHGGAIFGRPALHALFGLGASALHVQYRNAPGRRNDAGGSASTMRITGRWRITSTARC